MIHIITDSTCEAPDALLKHPTVSVLPLSVVFGQTSLRDGIDITRDQFWQRLPAADPLPTTSQATPGDFLSIFTQFTAAGDEVIAVTLSAKLSGIYDSAISARNSLPGNAPIDVIDSRTISVGLGLMLQEAVAMVEAGASGRDRRQTDPDAGESPPDLRIGDARIPPARRPDRQGAGVDGHAAQIQTAARHRGRQGRAGDTRPESR